jgi:RHS repeat-associated protein
MTPRSAAHPSGFGPPPGATPVPRYDLGRTARHRTRRGLVVTAVLVGLGLLPRPAGAQEVIEYYAQDALGSVRVVFDAAGQVTARADYEPFGEAFTWSGSVGGALPAERFTGQERDPEASQDYFGARYYQPRHGRFSQGDPVYAGLFDPQQWNRYAYARNNPLSFVDPDGRQFTSGVTCPVGGDGTSSCPFAMDPWNLSFIGIIRDGLMPPGYWPQPWFPDPSPTPTFPNDPPGPIDPGGPSDPPPPGAPPPPGVTQPQPPVITVGANVGGQFFISKSFGSGDVYRVGQLLKGQLAPSAMYSTTGTGAGLPFLVNFAGPVLEIGWFKNENALYGAASQFVFSVLTFELGISLRPGHLNDVLGVSVSYNQWGTPWPSLTILRTRTR